ncbi:MAG: glutamate--tRNA ligase [Anaerolineae bacterium]|nr:glutamate--tRNA ligase [Anaerolineae bacterium]
MDKPVRVRFAPSPTGYLHVGGARTALYDWLLARQTNGTFILRLEDTDRARFQKDAEADILDSLRWLGLQWDEGPEVGGEVGPYRQSQRTDLYRKYAQQLIDRGHAYKCFCTPERLAEVREQQKATGSKHTGYDRRCRDLAPDQVVEQEARGASFVVRIKAPLEGATSFHDILRGTTTVDNEMLEDIILLKSDGFPTYHLANVVDDHLMQISHIMRGEEWLSTCPIHVILYNAFGWEIPIYIHLPVFLDPGGQGKMSKRKKAGPGGQEYMVLVKDFRAAGYLPEALINYIARLGWSYDDRSELFSRQELLEKFSLDRLNASSAQFDYAKLEWMNSVYIRELAAEDLGERLLPFFRQAGLDASLDVITQIAPIVQERIKTLPEAVPLTDFIFQADVASDAQFLIGKKMDAASSLQALKKMRDLVSTAQTLTHEALEQPIRDLATEMDVKAGSVFGILRGAVTGRQVSPPLFETMAIMGRERTLKRIDLGIKVLEAL